MKLKPFWKIILQAIYGFAVFNTITTAGYLITNLLYKSLTFDGFFATVCALSGILWLACWRVNVKFNLNL